MTDTDSRSAAIGQGRSLLGSLKPYLEKESLAAFFLGMSSGFPYAMIGATLTTRLAQDGISKKTVTAFTLAFLVYNLKISLGLDRRWRAPAGDRQAGPAGFLDAGCGRAGDCAR